MKNAIILHGTTDEAEYFDPHYPSLSNAHWFPWLQKQLLVAGIAAATPEIPDAYKPDYDLWRQEVERYAITPETLIVGHSCGGGFWVRWLSEHPKIQVGKVVLAAPWLDPDNRKHSSFFDFEIDPKIARRTKGLAIFCSDNDSSDVLCSVEKLRATLQGYSYREFHNYGHFCMEDMHSLEFPELLDELLKDGVVD